MIKKLKRIKLILYGFVVFIAGLIILYITLISSNADSFHKIKYSVISSVDSIFQNEYEKSIQYKFKVPNEWILTGREENVLRFIGPTWNDKERFTVIQVFTEIEAAADYFKYFVPKYCKNLDSVVSITNTFVDDEIPANHVTLNNIQPIQTTARIVFCDDENLSKDCSFVSYENRAMQTLFIIMPYDKKYREKYIEVFKKIDYKK